MSNNEYNNIFSSLISDVKSYNGTDPLLPWLRGIRRMKETLPPQLLKEKLPRFLQKCSETFIANRRYSNDLRYLRVWLQLMDHVDDPKPILRTMEKNRIGMKKSLFYQAYALYYEKMKKFDAAEKIYHLGVQNLAEPADELQKSYELFLHRLERHKNKRAQLQGRTTNCRKLNQDEFRGCKDNSHRTDNLLPETDKFANIENKTVPSQSYHNSMPMQETNREQMAEKPSNIGVLSDAIVKSEDETNKSLDKSFEIYVDGEEANDVNEKVVSNSVSLSSNHALVFARPNDLPSECFKDPLPRRLLCEDTVVSRFVGSTISDEPEVENVCHHGLVDPTINLKEAMEDINNMFGKPIEYARKSRPKKHEKAPDVKSNCGEFLILPDDEPDDRKAEDDISDMFRRPVNMGTKCSLGNLDKVPDMMTKDSVFLILPDDELNNQQDSSSTQKRSDLFEQTLCTKEAMAEINKLFAMPMDF
ncbi:hypothetical protein ACS0TY_001047 [Phlomoides rotata]